MTASRMARFPVIAIGVIGLLTGLWAGLLRIGWGLPSPRDTLVGDHGPLMIAGFLGTLIGLERAVAVNRTWALAGPALNAAGTLALVIGLERQIGPTLMVAGGAGLVAMSALIAYRQQALFTLTLALGAAGLLGGNVVWLAGDPLDNAASWWIGFLVLTIAGERLELSRLVQVSRAGQAAFALIVIAFLAGIGAGGFSSDFGARLAGASMAALTGWLFIHDVARRTVRQMGLPRFAALSLMSGYAWLALAGGLALQFGGVSAGERYDAILHAVLLGFVFSMIFGHAPIILPAVLGVAVPFRPAFYAHVALLHASVALRVGGDLLPHLSSRRWGGMLSALAIVVFLGNTAYSVRLGFRKGKAGLRQGSGVQGARRDGGYREPPTLRARRSSPGSAAEGLRIEERGGGFR